MEQTFNPDQARKAQAEFAKSNNYPHFAPSTGVCWNCKKNIYQQVDRGTYKTGISVEKASSGLITGCPHCNRTYCD